MALTEVRVPDIGDFKDVEVIEVLVQAGDSIQAEDALITLESDKAVLEIPAPMAGVVREMKISQGDRVSAGSLLLLLEPAADTPSPTPIPTDPVVAAAPSSPAPSTSHTPVTPTPPPIPANHTGSGSAPPVPAIEHEAFKRAYAPPSVRKFARELGVDLSKVSGSGRKQRITRADVQGFVKDTLRFGSATSGSAQGGPGIPPLPETDFSQWGEIETTPLSRINQLTGEFLHRNWLNIPHVTQFDAADITEMEAFRQALNAEQGPSGGPKITPLVFIMKAVTACLQTYPRFNSALSTDGKNLIRRHYFHIGIAVDTADGLVVPVIRDVDRKSLRQLSEELQQVSGKAREKKLRPADMQGGCFSISSLGGIGGTRFTPIVNAPEVAILGVSRSTMQPVWNGDSFEPRLMLPLALSYDHRVIDGADGARFTTLLSQLLGDIRRLLL
ncbi:MAG TPA: dihydrolipoyllysine-residue acetyltransferase [Thiolinea sp.]|nr:dihydrolipoyllysine-residue acetyltransferase [Thiolinea sp.]